MSTLKNFVEHKIFSSLLDRFANMLDGHKKIEDQYVVVFTTYPSRATLSYGCACLAVSPLTDGKV